MFLQVNIGFHCSFMWRIKLDVSWVLRKIVDTSFNGNREWIIGRRSNFTARVFLKAEILHTCRQDLRTSRLVQFMQCIQVVVVIPIITTTITIIIMDIIMNTLIAMWIQVLQALMVLLLLLKQPSLHKRKKKCRKKRKKNRMK